MKIDDILAEIEADAVIDRNNLDMESLKIPMLHAKYYKIFMNEIRILKGLDSAFKSTKKERSMYYMGKLPDETYKEEPLDHKVLKADLDLYLDADPKLSEIRNRMEIQKAKTDLLESFIKTLNNRSFLIKNSIEFLRFQVGS